MASNSLDDLYRGCVKAMKRRLPSLLEEELEENQLFREAWDQAKEMWMQMENQTIFPKTLRALYSVAVLAYTLEEPPLYALFNVATRTAWKSPQAYAGFAFKSLHFLLTRAAEKLGAKEPSCAKVYRGTKVKFSIEGLFRFGQFTSTSEKRQEAEEFGCTTFFVLVSCQGFPVGNLSRFPGEEEMVVPPYEMFRVTGVKETPRKKMVHAKSVRVRGRTRGGTGSYPTPASPRGERPHLPFPTPGASQPVTLFLVLLHALILLKPHRAWAHRVAEGQAQSFRSKRGRAG
uniref:NAD(P)(+)--arginine ADP-ribosyltransferase n=1 Tax=Chrysemys picta bellii TaxID=8478 RepID=A0A8C3FV45_CHRPI